MLVVWEWRMTTDRMSLMVHSFGPSLENVTCLTVGHIVIHPVTLAMFISHFPRLDDLSISTITLPRALGRARDPHTEPYVGIVPTHPRGEFRASGIPTCRMPLKVFEAVTLLEPQFHRIILTHVDYDAWGGVIGLLWRRVLNRWRNFTSSHMGPPVSGLVSISDHMSLT